MSTVPMILFHERPGGPICRYLPSFHGREGQVRMLSIISDLHSWLYEQASPGGPRIKGAIRAHFGEFVRGDRVDDLDFMKRIEDRRSHFPLFSHGVWALSSRVNPQFRFFGFFAVPDWFILLCRQERNALNTDAAWHAE